MGRGGESITTWISPGGRELPFKRLMEMCRWMISHHVFTFSRFHDWIDYNVVALSIELFEWGRTFSDFWGKKNLQQTYKNICSVGEKQSVLTSILKNGPLHFRMT